MQKSHRIEEVAHNEKYREKYDLCTSRAVAHMRILLEYSLPMVKKQGLVVMWKGRNFSLEIEEAKKAMDLLGGALKEVFYYNLMDEFDRSLVVVNKVLSTPLRFPRRVGIPGKRPL